MTIFYVLAAILMLGIMVTIHECGHFWAARLTGIPVREFAIGFGPALKQWKSKKYDTVFFIRAIPAGGYCAFYGEDDPTQADSTDPKLYNNASPWKRFVTIMMGPMMNFILALVVACGFFLATGEPVDVEVGKCTIVSVTEGGPADMGGLRSGDIVDAVNGADASGMTDSGELTLISLISSHKEGDSALRMTVTRGGEQVECQVAPVYDQAEGRMMIGVTLQSDARYIYAPVNVFRSVELGAAACWNAGGAILGGLKDLVTTGKGIEDTGGPVRIVQVITEETREYGFEAWINLLMVISVNLGIMNLLPIPGLDGSRLLFLVVEGIRRKPLNRKVEAYVHTAGFVLLFGLFLVLTYRDLLHLFS